MSISVDDHQLAALVQKVDPGARLLRSWSLTGGVSAKVIALETARGSVVTRYVVRLHGDGDLAANPHIARDELTLLQTLRAVGLPVPAPYLVDDSLFERPCIVVEFVDGATEFAPANLQAYLRQCALALAQIHAVALTPALKFLPVQNVRDELFGGKRPAHPDESLDEGRIRAALEAAYPFPRPNPPALLHGDYWFGNILWNDGQLAAIIDWEDACIGDPLADAANCRLEILWAFGIDAMHEFTRHFLALRPLDAASLPCWDLYAALQPMHKLGLWAGGDAERERHMRAGHAQFVAQALQQLGRL